MFAVTAAYGSRKVISPRAGPVSRKPFPVVRENGRIVRPTGPPSAILAGSSASRSRSPRNGPPVREAGRVIRDLIPVIRAVGPVVRETGRIVRESVPVVRDCGRIVREVGPVVRAAVPAIRDVVNGQNSTVWGFREARKTGFWLVNEDFKQEWRVWRRRVLHRGGGNRRR